MQSRDKAVNGHTSVDTLPAATPSLVSYVDEEATLAAEAGFDLSLRNVSTTATADVNEKYYDTEMGRLNVLEPLNTIVTNASIIEEPMNLSYDDIPDGGYGWVVAIAGFLTNFIMFGIASIWGVFSNAYATTILKDKATTIQLMGVGTVLTVCLNLFTPLGPIFARLGIRVAMLIGTFIMALGLIMAGFSTEVWHLYLTQGIVFGAGASLTYMSIVAAIPQWFTTKRGTAMGISSAGSGFGGLALSPFASFLIEKYGLAWTYRIIGLVSFAVCVIASLLIRSRVPAADLRKEPIRFPIKLSMLKNTNFVIMLFGVVISLTGYLIPLFYIPKYGATYGISATDSSTILGVTCAMNAVGRLVLGYIADKIGRLNMYVISYMCAGILCMALWPFATTYGTLMAFAVVFGFFCGIYYTLAAPITASVVGLENISSGLSILFIASAVAAVGPPVCSAIQQVTPNESYIGVQMFAGSVYIFGCLICIFLKVKMTGSFFSIM